MADASSLGDWLRARHDQWNTPANLINEYVQKAAGSTIAQMSRVVLGVDNEVYDVTTTSYRQLIVRISHKENHRFEAERWALHAARSAGVPTPQVLLIEQAECDGSPVMFCIEEKVPGKPLPNTAWTCPINRASPCFTHPSSISLLPRLKLLIELTMCVTHQ